MSFKLDTAKFKKVSGDKHHTVLRHDDGHELKIAHKNLSPKLRGQIAELPVIKMADGGIPGGSGSPAMDSAAAKKSDDYYKDHPHESLGDMVSNIKHAFDPAPEPKTTPTKNYADGGQVADPNKKDAEDFAKGMANTDMDPIAKAAKKLLGMADGGQVNSSSAQDSPDQIAADAAASAPPPPPQQPAAQAPVIVNVGAQQSAPPMPPMSYADAKGGGDPDATQVPPQMPAAPQAPAAIAPQQGLAPPSQQMQPPSGAQADPYGTVAQSNAALKGLSEQKAGIQGAANAMSAQAQAEQSIEHANAAKQLQTLSDYQTQYAGLDKLRQQSFDALQQQKIDPQRYWNDKSTLGKIGTMIGLALGGAGAALSGQEPVLAKQLNLAIDRDIMAQKAEMDKKENLLRYNMDHFKNIRDATDMTRVLQMSAVASQLKEQADKYGSPIAQANARQAIGKLDSDSAALMGQMAMRKTLLNGMANGQVPPERIVNFLVPPEQRQAANKELIDAQNMARARDNVLSAFDKLTQINTVGNRISSPIQTAKQVNAIKGPIVAGLSKETAGRFTDQDAKMLDSLFPAYGDNQQTQQLKRAQAVKLLTEKMNFPILQSYGINLGNSGRFSNSGQSRIQESAPVINKK